MSSRRQTFRQADLLRALKAARAAGITVASFEIQDGKIVIVSGEGRPPAEPASQFDDWKAKRDARAS